MPASGEEVRTVMDRRRFLTMSSGLLAGAFLSACISMEDKDPESKDVEVLPEQVPHRRAGPNVSNKIVLFFGKH
jgi:hypothetical protein